MGTKLAGVLAACSLTIALPLPAADLASSTAIVVRDIKIDGDDIISHQLLNELLPRYRNRTTSADELLQLAQQLTAHLIEQGYVNSGVILPDQKVEDGVVHLQVIAGSVQTIVVSGNKQVSQRYIAARVATPKSEPFNINDSVRRLQLLERNPRIKKLNAELKPSVARGTALLNIDVEEERAYGYGAAIDNHLSPNVGANQATLDFYHLSLFGWGDTLAVNYRYAEGFSGGSLSYSVPINSYDTTVAATYDHNTTEIVTEPFAQLEIEGKTTGYGIALRQPFDYSLNTQFSVGLGLRKERVESFLLGEPFSFSVSNPDGVSQATLVQLTQEWVNRSAARVTALRSSFNIGVDALQASVGGEGDGRFVEWLAQGEWLQKMAWRDNTLGLKLQLHLSDDVLPAYRKYPLGGANSVRGYRENLLTRDNGVLASIEWTVVVARLPVKWLGKGPSDGQLSVLPFLDYGYGWDYYDTPNAPLDIASIGLGVRWQMARNSSVDLQLAKALIDRDNLVTDRVLQDDGVHFSVRVGF